MFGKSEKLFDVEEVFDGMFLKGFEVVFIVYDVNNYVFKEFNIDRWEIEIYFINMFKSLIRWDLWVMFWSLYLKNVKNE